MLLLMIVGQRYIFISGYYEKDGTIYSKDVCWIWTQVALAKGPDIYQKKKKLSG